MMKALTGAADEKAITADVKAVLDNAVKAKGPFEGK